MVKNKKGKENEENNKKKKALIVLIILLLLVGIFLLWWFNRKFDITIKYNNGLEDNVSKVKYLHFADKENAKDDITSTNANLIGYFETYTLNEKELEMIKNNSEAEKTICREGFKLNSDKNKCIAEKEFDFENTKIKGPKTIEALWSTIAFTINPTSKTILEKETFNIIANISGTKDKTITWTSDKPEIAIVNSNGKVEGIKEGTAIITAESNGIKRICTVVVKTKETSTTTSSKTTTTTTATTTTTTTKPKDNGTISLKTDNNCLVGHNEVATITATINNATDKNITWSLPKCYTAQKVSDTVYKINRTGRGTQCRDVEETSFTVAAKLNNGSSDSVKINYEQSLEAKVYSNSSLLATLNNGDSKDFDANNVNIKTNIPVTFDGRYISSKTDTSMSLDSVADSNITIKSKCGQSAKVNISAVIN